MDTIKTDDSTSDFDIEDGELDSMIESCETELKNMENNNQDINQDSPDENDDEDDQDNNPSDSNNDFEGPVTEKEIKKTCLSSIKKNYKEIILVFVLFVVLSLPMTGSFVGKYITFSESNLYINIFLRGLLFALIWTVFVAMR